MTIQTSRFLVPDMHCASCPKIIKMNLEEVPGVTDVIADLDTKIVTVTFDTSQTNLQALASVITASGYTPEITHQS